MDEWQAYVTRFRREFGPFFPKLCADFDASSREVQWLDDRYFGNAYEGIRKAVTAREIEKLGNLLVRIQSLNLDVFKMAGASLFHQEPKTESTQVEREIFDLLHRAKNDPVVFKSGVSDFTKRLKHAVEIMPDRGNTNWAGVNGVEALATLWWRNTGRWGPMKALNRESKFANFLRIGFRYLEIDADPVSAFRAAAKFRKVT